MNAKNATKLGRKPLKIRYPKGAFTIDELFAANSKANGGTVKCELTIRNHIKRDLAEGKLVQVEKVLTGKAGAPAFRFQLKSVREYNIARAAKRAAAPVETPVEAEPVLA